MRFRYGTVKKLVAAADRAEDCLGTIDDEEQSEARKELTAALEEWRHLQRNPGLEYLQPFWFSTGEKNKGHLMVTHCFVRQERSLCSGQVPILLAEPSDHALCGENPRRSNEGQFSPAPEADRCSRCLSLSIEQELEEDLLSGIPNMAPARIGDTVEHDWGTQAFRFVWVLRDPETLILARANGIRQPEGKAVIVEANQTILRSLEHLKKPSE